MGAADSHSAIDIMLTILLTSLDSIRYVPVVHHGLSGESHESACVCGEVTMFGRPLAATGTNGPKLRRLPSSATSLPRG